MKLFIGTESMLIYPCGIAVYVKQLLREFVKDYNYDIYTALKALSPKTHARLRQKIREHIDNNIKCRSIYLPGRYSWTPLQKIIAPKCDIAHFTSNIIPPYLPCYDITKSVITIHDMFMWHTDMSFYNKNVSSYYFQHQPEQAQNCAAVITVSEFSKKEIVNFLGIPEQKIHVIPIATQWDVALPEQCNILSQYGLEKKKYFLSVSTLHKHKNHTGLCQAFAKYHSSKNYAGEKLVIVGSRQYGDENIYDQFLHTPDMIHIPRVSEIELRYLYAEAKGFFLVSKLEGFGIPLLEAMSCRIPACYGKGNSMDEIGRDAAVGAEPEDIDSIADVFHYFSESSADLQDRIEKAYQISQEYSWQKTAEKHSILYQQVVKNK